jgi:anti-sigma factor ChrR (cupin superfamily)
MEPDDRQPIPLDDASAALAVTLEPVRPPSELRRRLMQRVAEHTEPRLGAVLSTEGKWRDAKSPGVHYKVLYFDKAAGLVTTLVRLDPGARFPAHTHARTEQCMVLEGDLRHGDHVYGRGDFTWAEAGSVDPELHTEGGALLLIIGAPEAKRAEA